MENYEAYLKSDEWKNRRKAFKSRSCGRCFICERKSCEMEVHHKTYYRNGKSILHDERDDELCLLCHDCHEAIHKYFLDGYLRENIDDKSKKEKMRKEIERLKTDSKKVILCPPQRHFTVGIRKHSYQTNTTKYI